ncbi:alpha/beta hydrolase [Lactobacillus sp.]|uniref:alpha/beta hydrolase fold domain-containing protein n=1 Tax=Lactobacillus sp. TaxID=1591 RepID=UPI0019CA3E06|nr:alpha/beta hydrolase [Lactobacillus sp.]MBD5430684.1 alpha/beta hydrolase [Lactobacillus sp.]
MVLIKKDILYDEKKNLATDIYFPNDTNSETKILIFWHGGGWFRGSKDTLQNIGVSLANAGFMTLIPNYSLAPKYHFPTAHQDSDNFIQWLLNSQYTDDDDLKNIMQIGASAGGTLALYLAGKYGFPTVTWSAPVDFSNWMKQHSQTVPAKDAANELNLTDSHQIKDAFYKYFVLTYAGSENSDILTQMDASSYNFTHLNRLKMINSANELTSLESVLNFVKFLAKHDHEVELLVIKGTGHAMDYADEYLDESVDFLYQTIKDQEKKTR